MMRSKDGTGGAWMLLGLLIACNLFNSIDAVMPFLLMESIRRDIPMSDTAIGLIGSVTYTLAYALFGIVLGRLADRRSRTRIIGFAVAGWSLMASLTGAATGFAWLALCRVGVAMGESAVHPTAPSIIADIFAANRRRLALSLFFAGQSLGTAIGHAVGGWSNDHFGWRVTLVATAAPGLLLGLAFLAIKDPPRTGEGREARPASLPRAVAALWAIPSYRWLLLAASVCMFASSGIARFLGIFLIRTLHMSTQDAGTHLGVVFGLGGIVGNIAIGFVTDRLARRDERWTLWIVCVAMLLSFGFYVAMWRLQDTRLIYWLLAPAWMCSTMFMAPCFHLASALGREGMRALAPSVIMFCMFVFGASGGSLVIGMVSDALKGAMGVRSIAAAMETVSYAFPLAALLFLAAARSLRRDLGEPAAA
jgi:predicted MFS family arabinose efflux permease